MQHIRWLKRYGEFLIFYSFVRTTVIGVVQPPILVSVHRHLVRHQGIQSNDFILAVADDLRVGIAPEEQMRHERFPEYKGAHFRIRLIMEQAVERMVERHGLTAAVRVFV